MNTCMPACTQTINALKAFGCNSWAILCLMNIEGWLTQEEAAQKLHIALDTMRRYVREGRFPRTKVGKRYLIPASAIEEFLREGLLTGPRKVTPRKKVAAVKKRKYVLNARRAKQPVP